MPINRIWLLVVSLVTDMELLLTTLISLDSWECHRSHLCICPAGDLSVNWISVSAFVLEAEGKLLFPAVCSVGEAFPHNLPSVFQLPCSWNRRQDSEWGEWFEWFCLCGCFSAIDRWKWRQPQSHTTRGGESSIKACWKKTSILLWLKCRARFFFFFLLKGFNMLALFGDDDDGWYPKYSQLNNQAALYRTTITQRFKMFRSLEEVTALSSKTRGKISGTPTGL